VLGNAICDVVGAREVSRTGESKGGVPVALRRDSGQSGKRSGGRLGHAFKEGEGGEGGGLVRRLAPGARGRAGPGEQCGTAAAGYRWDGARCVAEKCCARHDRGDEGEADRWVRCI
jgi:hypothetical protein